MRNCLRASGAATLGFSFLLLQTAGYAGAKPPPKHLQTRTQLIVGHPGISLENRSTLLIAFPLVNSGKTTARRVIVSSVRVEGAQLVSPRLPATIGDIAPDEDGTVYATFRARSFTPEKGYLVSVSGTFNDGEKFSLQRTLRVPPADRSSSRARSASTQPHKVKGGKYPPMPPGMGEDMNPDRGWKVPIGHGRAVVTPSPETGARQGTPGGQLLASLIDPLNMLAPPAPPTLTFKGNFKLGISGSTTAEPSGAVAGKVVFTTANWSAAYSTNGGSSFHQINPTTIFPNGADGGFCCDQIVVYSAKINRFLWLMQFSTATDAKGNVRNRYRLAAASPNDIVNSNGTQWTYWDFTTGLIGISNGWLDYPDLSVGTNSLYLSYDQVGVGRAVIRMPLSQIQASSTINFRYTDPTKSPMAYGDHLTQDTGDEIFWAGHNSTTSMRVFSWQESSTSYFWRDVSIASWSNSSMTSSSPDSQDWLTKLRNFPGNAVLGSARIQSGRTNQVLFAWTAGPSGNMKQPQVQWVALDRNNNFNRVSQHQVWNNSYAFAYPAFATNSKNEIGMSLEYGGSSDYENHVVGFWGDFIVYITTATNVGITRFGDCVTIRRDTGNKALFDAFGYGLTKASPASSIVQDSRYVQFGR